MEWSQVGKFCSGMRRNKLREISAELGVKNGKICKEIKVRNGRKSAVEWKVIDREIWGGMRDDIVKFGL